MHPLLLLITLGILRTSALSTEQSNPAKLRPERILETFACHDPNCSENLTFKGNGATYSFFLQTESQLQVGITTEERDLTMVLEATDFPLIGCYIFAYTPDGIRSYGYFFYLGEQKMTLNFTGIGSVAITFTSTASNHDANITVTIIGLDNNNNNEHKTPGWVIPVSVSIGALLAVTVVVVLCYYYQRSVRQWERRRRYAQSVNMRNQNIQQSNENLQPRQEANIQQRNENPQPRQEANPPQELSTQKIIIDIRFPEARFEQFESEFPQKTCSICLEDMKKEQMCRQLDCQHIFHTQCGKQWLENQFEKMNKAFCPNCNEQVNVMNTQKCPKTQKERVK